MIDKEKFFKYCKIVTVNVVSERLGVGNTAVYNWISDNRIPPIKWEAVDQFMKDLEEKNKDLLAKRLREYDRRNKKPSE